MGMPAGPVTRSATASALALEVGPTIAWTRSSSTSRRATATAFSGSSVESPTTNCTGWPKTPPAALTCWTANSKACCRSTARAGAPSLRFTISPSRNGPGSSAGASPLQPSHPYGKARRQRQQDQLGPRSWRPWPLPVLGHRRQPPVRMMHSSEGPAFPYRNHSPPPRPPAASRRRCPFGPSPRPTPTPSAPRPRLPAASRRSGGRRRRATPAARSPARSGP